MDKKLLLNIFKIAAPSNSEYKMAEFIENFLKENKINFTTDSEGNIFNVDNKNTPLLSAHMDTVQGDIDTKLTNFIKIRGNVLSGYGIIGADDKCGIYIILNLLRQRKLNFIFSVGEETGAHGIRHFISKTDLRNIPYGIVLDRRGSGDIICSKNDYGIQEFETVLTEIGKVFKYSPAMGTFSDADFLNEKISCANLSVGYYNAHSKDEFVLLDELNNAECFVFSIVKNVKEKFKKPEKYSAYGNYNSPYNSGYDNFDDFGDLYTCVFCKEAVDIFYLQTIEKYVCKACAETFIYDVKSSNLVNDIDSDEALRELEREYYKEVGEI